MRLILAALMVIGASPLAACDRREPATVQEQPLDEAATSTSTAVVFDLSPAEKTTLSERALMGDPEASFRMAQYYGLAGGDGDPNTNDENDRLQERRWLELAATQGHQAAEFNLAVSLTRDDCPRARSMMMKIRSDAESPSQREEAVAWLSEPQFVCQ